MQTSLNILICFLILYFNFVRLNASELIVSLPEIQIEGIPAMNPCKNDSDCQGVKDAVCIDDYCSCNGSKFCPNILEFKVTKLGEQCRQSSNCHIEHSVCLNRICECVTGMVPSLNKKECLEESSRNCTKLGNCSQSTAINCPRGFVRNAESTKCLRVPQIFQSSCREDAQCSEQFGNAVCINATTCQCQPSYQYDNISEKCISLEINCREDKDCLDSEQEEDANLFSCVMGVCKPCFEDEELCKNRPETGPCLDHSCNGSSANVESRTCNTGRCECPEERQFCVNNADSDGVRFRGHPIHKHISTRKPRILRPFTKVKNANKWPHNLLKKHRIASGLDTQQADDSVVKVPAKPIWYKRPLFLISFALIFLGAFFLTILISPTIIDLPRYTETIQFFSAINLTFIACSMLWMLKYYKELTNLLSLVVFIFFCAIGITFIVFLKSLIMNYLNTRIPPELRRLRDARRGSTGYGQIYTLPITTPPGDQTGVPYGSSSSPVGEHSQVGICAVDLNTYNDYTELCIPSYIGQPDSPSSPQAGPSSRPDELSSRRDAPSSRRTWFSSRRAGPGSPQAGPSSRPGEPSSRRAGPSSRRDWPGTPRAGPSTRAGPSSRPDEPSSRREKPGSRRDSFRSPREGPSSPREGPSSPREGPSSPSGRREGHSSRRDLASSSRIWFITRPDDLGDRRDSFSSRRAGPKTRREEPGSRPDVEIPLSEGAGAVCFPDRRSMRSREPLSSSASQPEDLQRDKEYLNSDLYESTV